MDTQSIKDVNQVNGVFTIDSRLHIQIEDDRITYSREDVCPYEKRYNIDERDLKSYISNSDRAIFLAYVDHHVVGQIIIRKNWNKYAYIEDLIVDVAYRRQGIGVTLLEQAKRWAKEKKLPGIMLETQNNNVAACILYESFGFTLEGVDFYLYKGLNPSTDEIALYWYYFF